AFIPLLTGQIDEILCEQYERTVRRDNCVVFEGMTLQIPPDRYRSSYFKTVVRVQRYPDNSLSIFHGTRKLATYHPNGTIKTPRKEKAA
ncbi:transposase, partial [bacterium]|nr:transposase [bacterium]